MASNLDWQVSIAGILIKQLYVMVLLTENDESQSKVLALLTKHGYPSVPMDLEVFNAAAKANGAPFNRYANAVALDHGGTYAQLITLLFEAGLISERVKRQAFAAFDGT